MTGVLMLFCQIPGCAELKPDLLDAYLERELDWAMFIELPGSNHYLNYAGSQLYPLTIMRINFRAFGRGTGAPGDSAKIYEELWYHKGKPVGSRRYSQLDIPTRHIGAIVVGAIDNKNEQSQAVANALVRLVLDLQLKKISPAIVLVPNGSYDQIAEGLGRYNFVPDILGLDGPQMSIHLRSYPQNKEHYFYYSKRN